MLVTRDSSFILTLNNTLNENRVWKTVNKSGEVIDSCRIVKLINKFKSSQRVKATMRQVDIHFALLNNALRMERQLIRSNNYVKINNFIKTNNYFVPKREISNV